MSEQILNGSILQSHLNLIIGYTAIQLLNFLPPFSPQVTLPLFLPLLSSVHQTFPSFLPPSPRLFFLPLTQNALQAEQAQLRYKKASNGGGRAAVQQELCRRTHTGIQGKAAPFAEGSKATARKRGQYRGRKAW